MFTRLFWKDTTERAIMTAAQTFVALFGADYFNVLEADWTAMLATAAGGGVLAVAKALAAYKKDSNVSPASLV